MKSPFPNKINLVIVDENVDRNGEKKYFAWSTSCSGNSFAFRAICRADHKSVNVCVSGKAARELANYWNECFKANGTYSLYY